MIQLKNFRGNKYTDVKQQLLVYNIEIRKGSGIYKIINFIDSRIYVGSSKNLYKRFCYHRNDLEKQQHCNYNLQKFYNEYPKYLSFCLIEFCNEDELKVKEQYYLDTLCPFNKNGFNIFRKAIGGFDKHTEESKKLMSLQRKGVKRGKYSKAHGTATSEGLKNSQAAKNHLAKLHLNNQKTYFFINPNGLMIKITNLKRFCKENNLCDSKMVAVYKEKRISHRGWKKYKTLNDPNSRKTIKLIC